MVSLSRASSSSAVVPARAVSFAPAVVRFIVVLDASGRQLLQQQATGTHAVGVEPEHGADLLGHHPVVGEAIRQGFAVEVDDSTSSAGLRWGQR